MKSKFNAINFILFLLLIGKKVQIKRTLKCKNAHIEIDFIILANEETIAL